MQYKHVFFQHLAFIMCANLLVLTTKSNTIKPLIIIFLKPKAPYYQGKTIMAIFIFVSEPNF